jgi:uncharacterized protein YjbI with pentapeptide repeats
MPNQEHLDILKQGEKLWNRWRAKNATIRPDLRGADLKNVDLRGVDLSEADLSEAKLSFDNISFADLSNADLREADLVVADLSYTNLSNADLSNADLSEADFSDANLSEAKLVRAKLVRAKLIEATLNKADLRVASVGWTVFGDVDLSTVKGLDTVDHAGPSTIGIDTIYLSHGDIPEAFLKGAGVDDIFIAYIRSLVGKEIEYYSCFISYSSKDNAFAKRLYNDLQSHNVRCWYAPEDLKWGAKIHPGIDEAIRVHDKLLLILSQHSISSGWVEHEVKTALAKESREKRVVLFPLRLDQAVLDSPLSWATEIRRERNIGNFSSWKNHDSYQAAFDRLLRDLKAEV